MPENSAPGIPWQASEADMARQATHGTLAMQLRNIERQAGVRRTL